MGLTIYSTCNSRLKKTTVQSVNTLKKGEKKRKLQRSDTEVTQVLPWLGFGSVAEVRGDARQSDSLSLSASFTSTLNLYSWSQPM